MSLLITFMYCDINVNNAFDNGERNNRLALFFIIFCIYDAKIIKTRYIFVRSTIGLAIITLFS